MQSRLGRLQGEGGLTPPRERRSAADDRSNRLQFGLLPHSFILELCATTTYRRCKEGEGGRKSLEAGSKEKEDGGRFQPLREGKPTARSPGERGGRPRSVFKKSIRVREGEMARPTSSSSF